MKRTTNSPNDSVSAYPLAWPAGKTRTARTRSPTRHGGHCRRNWRGLSRRQRRNSAESKKMIELRWVYVPGSDTPRLEYRQTMCSPPSWSSWSVVPSVVVEPDQPPESQQRREG